MPSRSHFFFGYSIFCRRYNSVTLRHNHSYIFLMGILWDESLQQQQDLTASAASKMAPVFYLCMEKEREYVETKKSRAL